MKKNATLFWLLISLSSFVFGQPNTIKSNNKFSLNKETVSNENSIELNTKQCEQFYQKLLSLFVEEGYIIQENSGAIIVPKLFKISQTESNELFEKEITSKYSLNIILKGIDKNETIFNTFSDEIIGSGTTANESVLNAIDKIPTLSSKVKFKKFLTDLNNKVTNNLVVSQKKNEIIAPNNPKYNYYQIDKSLNNIDKSINSVDKSDKSVNVRYIKNTAIVQPDSKNTWLADFLSNTNNLFGIIASFSAFFVFLWGLKMKKKAGRKSDKK
jgi:hypothetical protein